MASIIAPTHSNEALFPFVNHTGHRWFGEEITVQDQDLIETSKRKRTLDAAKRAFKHFAFFFKIVCKIVKKILKVVSLSVAEIAQKITSVIAMIGMTAILKPVFVIKSLLRDIRNLKTSQKTHDAEGVALSATNLVFRLPQLADGLLSFGNSLNKLIGLPWMVLFSAVTFPISLGLICYDTIRSIIKTVQISVEFSKMPKTAADSAYMDFRRYLEEKVGITHEERSKIEKEIEEKYALCSFKKPNVPIIAVRTLEQAGPRGLNSVTSIQQDAEKELHERIELIKARKIHRLTRATDKKIVQYMQNAKKYLEDNPGKMRSAEKSLADIRKLTARKLTFTVGEVLFRIVQLVMSAVSFVFPFINPWVAIGISCANTAFSIGKKLYLSYGMGKGLYNPQFYPSKAKCSSG